MPKSETLPEGDPLKPLTEIERNRQQISILEEQVSTSQTFLPSPQDLALAQKDKIAELKVLRNSRSASQDQLNEVQARIDELNEEAGLQRFVPKMLGGESASGEIGSLRGKRDALETEIDTLDDQIMAAQDELRCIEGQIVGEGCESWLGKIASAGKKSIERLSTIVHAADESLMAVTLILAAVLANNVLFPIIFLIVAVKLTMPIAKAACRLRASARRESDELGRGTNQTEHAAW